MKSRFIEIDLLRTLAIVMMIVYHIGYDLAFFHNFDLDPLAGGWKLLALSTATLFLLLVGISFVISWDRTHSRTRLPTEARRAKVGTRYKYFKRGLTILAFGLLITIVTYFWDRETYIRFGILHMIGVSVILLPFFRKLREWNIAIAALIIILGMNIRNFSLFTFHSSLFLPFGIPPPNFTTLDYYPLLPWFGIVLTGLALGDLFYIRPKRIPKPTNRILTFLSFPGKHALVIYLVHQPILLLLLGIWFNTIIQ
ncbi:DUF1624 domain-containing protein [Patescibacteria group bacterium]|nr:DUF1624 domain-containing protein [Patescibacteria group bacterium]